MALVPPKQSDTMVLGCSQTTECSLQESIKFIINLVYHKQNVNFIDTGYTNAFYNGEIQIAQMRAALVGCGEQLYKWAMPCQFQRSPIGEKQ